MKIAIKFQFVVLMVCLISCKSEVEPCQIDLYLCENISDKFLKTSQVDILLPTKYPDGSITLPSGLIISAKGSISYKKPTTQLEKFRGSITKNTSIAILTEKIKNHLQKLDLSPIWTEIIPSLDSINEQIKKHDATLIINAKCSETTIKGIPCFTNAQDVRAYIIDSLILTKHLDKILVLDGFPTQEKDKDTIDVFQTETLPYEDDLTGDIPYQNDNNDKKLLNNLHSDLLDLGLNKMSPNERFKLVPVVYSTYFETKAFIKRVTPESRRTMEVYENDHVKDYLISLTAQIELDDIKVIEIFKGPSGKLRGVTLAEIKK